LNRRAVLLPQEDDVESHHLYGQLRKVAPLSQALNSLSPAPQFLLSGLRASQTEARSAMPRISQSNDGRYKLLPLLRMSDADTDAYMEAHGLPSHPLVKEGYLSVGDWHSSRPAKEGEDVRATRFGGKFAECGLHVETHEALPSQTAAAAANPVEEDAIASILESTGVSSQTGYATRLVKKKMEDGSWCAKCDDVASRLDKDGTGEWVGGVSVADVLDSASDGKLLATHFDQDKAPFFIVKEEGEEEWRVIYSYGQWKSTMKKAAKAR